MANTVRGGHMLMLPYQEQQGRTHYRGRTNHDTAGNIEIMGLKPAQAGQANEEVAGF